MGRTKKRKAKKTKNKPWPDNKTDELIGKYEEHPCLYDKVAAGYAKRELREATYQEIGDHFSVDGDEIEERLSTLRTRFGRIRRDELKAASKSGSAPVERTEEVDVFMKKMNFLWEHIVPRGTQDTLQRQEKTEDDQLQDDDRDEEQERQGRPEDEAYDGDNYGDLDDGNEGDDGDATGAQDEDPTPVVGAEEIVDGTSEHNTVETELEENRPLADDVQEIGDNPGDNPGSAETRKTEIANRYAAGTSKGEDAGKWAPPYKNDDTEDVWPTREELNDFEKKRKELMETTKSPYNPDGTPRSPTPPLGKQHPIIIVKSATKPTYSKTTEPKNKGIGKNTIRRPKITNPPKPTGKHKIDDCKSKDTTPSQSPRTAMENKRLKVLEKLSDNIEKEIEEEDEDFHWNKSVGHKVRRIRNPNIKEESVGTINAILTDAVLGIRHPALDWRYFNTNRMSIPTNPNTFSLGYPQTQQYYLTAPTIQSSGTVFQGIPPPQSQVNINPQSSPVLPQQGQQNITNLQQRPQVSQQQQQSQIQNQMVAPNQQHQSQMQTHTGTSQQQQQPSQIVNPIQNQITTSQQQHQVQMQNQIQNQIPTSQQQQQSQLQNQGATAYTQYGSIPPDLAAYLPNSPLKVIATQRCQRVNTYAAPPPSNQIGLEFAQL